MKPSYFSTIDPASIKMMDCDSKVGVLATEDEDGYTPPWHEHRVDTSAGFLAAAMADLARRGCRADV